MMQQVNRNVGLITTCIACTTLCATKLTCPDEAYLGGFARLSCSTSSPYANLQYTGPNKLIAPQCVANRSSCSPVGGFNGSLINATHTYLMILKVKSKHAGLWTCEDAKGGGPASCELRVEGKGRADANNTGISWIIILAAVVALIVILIAVVVAVCAWKARKQQSNSQEGKSDRTSKEVDPTYDTVAEPAYDTVADTVNGPNETMESSNSTQVPEDIGAYACVDIVPKATTTVPNPHDDPEKSVVEMYATVNRKKETDKKKRC